MAPWPTAVPLPALSASPAAARSKASGSSDGLQAGFYQDPGNTVYSTALRVLERVAVRLGKPALIHTNKGIQGDIIEATIGAVFHSGLASATRARTRNKLTTKPACSQQITRAPRVRPAMRRQTGHVGELGARALEPLQFGRGGASGGEAVRLATWVPAMDRRRACVFSVPGAERRLGASLTHVPAMTRWCDLIFAVLAFLLKIPRACKYARYVDCTAHVCVPFDNVMWGGPGWRTWRASFFGRW